jgi:hypothetical protein
MAATQDETLVSMALRMALLARRPEAGLLFHSDRGSQYTCDAYQALLVDAQVTVSMSRTGNCYDNAVDFRHFKAGYKLGKPFSSTPSVSITGFGGTPRLVTKAWSFMNN